jgi:hypothetical protein
MELPDKMTPAIREALGMMNFDRGVEIALAALFGTVNAHEGGEGSRESLLAGRTVVWAAIDQAIARLKPATPAAEGEPQ